MQQAAAAIQVVGFVPPTVFYVCVQDPSPQLPGGHPTRTLYQQQQYEPGRN